MNIKYIMITFAYQKGTHFQNIKYHIESVLTSLIDKKYIDLKYKSWQVFDYQLITHVIRYVEYANFL